jgi:hypothetical protein
VSLEAGAVFADEAATAATVFPTGVIITTVVNADQMTPNPTFSRKLACVRKYLLV